MDISNLHGKRVAIVLQRADSHQTLRGRASYEGGHRGGQIRIRLEGTGESDGNPEFLLDVTALEQLERSSTDCDYVLRLECGSLAQLFGGST